MLDFLQLPFVQRGLLEILLLAVPAGVLGTWIVLRGLAFFSHAVGTATFPGLVLADGLGFAPALGAFAAAAAFAAGNGVLRRRSGAPDATVALVLVACLAGGVILAADVFGSGASVDTLLFGSLLLVDARDLALAAAVAAATLPGTFVLGPRWLRRGFDSETAPAGREAALLDAVLLGLIALATTAALTVVGALLVAALFVVPAITARLFTGRLVAWQLASVALVAAEGCAGLWLSVETDAPPGATIACVSGATFVAVVAARGLGRRPRAALPAAAALSLAILVGGCGSSGGGEAGRVDAIATTTEVGDWVREVGGDAVSVDQVLEPNSDPHEYEARPSDVVAAAGAELAFASGDGLDDWIGEVVSDSGGDAELVDLGAAVPERLAAAADEEGATDPHWWHDPRNAEAAVREIERRLSRADPAHAKLFARNTDAYVARLRALDRRIARCMGAIPPAQRKLVTDHDAFGYFADRYGIEVVGAVIPSQTTGAQPSAKDLTELARTIEQEGVTAIFPESSLSPKLAQAVARQTGVTAAGDLYGDTLGPEGSAGATYLGMEGANAETMARGFTEGRRGCPRR